MILASSDFDLALGAITFRDRPFASILSAASASGYRKIGLTVGQCISALERGVDLADLPKLLADHGLGVAELELVRLGSDGAVLPVNETVLELAQLLTPDRVHVAAFAGTRSRILEDFVAVCERLPETTVAIEFMPYSEVRDLTEAASLVRETGQANAGIVLDVLHFFRSGDDPARLTAADVESVASVQLSDVCTRPGMSLVVESRHHRTFPGHGELDIEALLARLSAVAGGLPPITVESVSDAIEQLPLTWVAEQAMFATRRVLTRVRDMTR